MLTTASGEHITYVYLVAAAGATLYIAALQFSTTSPERTNSSGTHVTLPTPVIRAA